MKELASGRTTKVDYDDQSTSSRYAHAIAGLLITAWLVGCGTTKSQQATEQLLMSDAVDRAVADISFSELAGEKVYFDTRYISTSFKPVGFVSADYIISALRQQLTAANCQLQDSKDDADYIVEARVGALGTDGHNLTVGVPASNALSTAASLVPSAPVIPAIPEISLVRRDDKTAAAKIAVFAYHRETKEPVWQSGIAQAHSRAHDMWVLGAGPFQRGSIHRGTRFAGSKLDVPLIGNDGEEKPTAYANYSGEVRFVRQATKATSPVLPAAHAQEITDNDVAATKPAETKAAEGSTE